MTPRCPTCPVRPDLTCPVETTGHRRFCQLADPDHPGHSPKIRDDLVADSEGRPRATPVFDAPMRIAAAPSPLAADLARRQLVMACDYRGEARDDCGCGEYRTCLMGKGKDGVVTWTDCLLCMGASPIDSPGPSEQSERANSMAPTGGVEC